MRQIMITGATGNIGTEVIRSLMSAGTGNKIIAGVRDIGKAVQLYPDFKNIDYRNFDFEDPLTFDSALDKIDCIFLLRPPHISDVDRYFKPLIRAFTEKGIKQVMFLSVQGAEKSRVIPHNKIERLIRDSGLDFIFLRPGYFMQNLTTALINDIRVKKQLILPAGKAKFNWIDIKDIGEAAAVLLDNFTLHKNSEIELTGPENLDFNTVAGIISKVTNDRIQFVNLNPFGFYRLKKREGLSTGLVIVMILLHFLPRLQAEPRISNNFEILTGHKPTTLEEFISRERDNLKR